MGHCASLCLIVPHCASCPLRVHFRGKHKVFLVTKRCINVGWGGRLAYFLFCLRGFWVQVFGGELSSRVSARSLFKDAADVAGVAASVWTAFEGELGNESGVPLGALLEPPRGDVEGTLTGTSARVVLVTPVVEGENVAEVVEAETEVERLQPVPVSWKKGSSEHVWIGVQFQSPAAGQ
eukprot:533067-Amphidinium_carterae.2